MKFNINKYLALGAIGLSSVFFVSCDDSSSSGSGGPNIGEPKITFPKEFQSGDQIIFDDLDIWAFSGPDTFDWSGVQNTFSKYRKNTSDQIVTIEDAGVEKEAAEVIFQARIDFLLEDFDSILRTIPLERVDAGEELTLEDLRAFEELINEDVAEDGQAIVILDEEEVRLILALTYDVTLQVTSGIDSFAVGLYSGNYSATHRGAVIKFTAPNSAERKSYRMTYENRLPRVTSSYSTLPEPIEGDFVWTLTSTAPPEAPVVEPEDDRE
jgi:hypothetical protein